MKARYSDELLAMMQKLYQSLSEKDRRRYAAIEAKKIGYGGITYISELFGCSRETIKAGLHQLETMDVDALKISGIRSSGAGRKRLLDTVEGLEQAFYSVLQEYSSQEHPSLRQIKISQRQIGLLLEEKGFRVSGTVIKQLVEKYKGKA